MKADVVPFGQGETAFVRHALLAERSELNDLPTALGVSIVHSADLDATPLLASARRPSSFAEPTRRRAMANAAPTLIKVGVSRQGLDGPGAGELMFVLRWLGSTRLPCSRDVEGVNGKASARLSCPTVSRGTLSTATIPRAPGEELRGRRPDQLLGSNVRV